MSLDIRKIQIKTTMRYLYMTIRLTKIKIIITPNVGNDIEKLDHSNIAGRNVKW